VAQLYSALLSHGLVLNFAVNQALGAPAVGTIWVVRDIVVYPDGLFPGWADWLYIHDPIGAPLLGVSPKTATFNQSVHWEGRQVIDDAVGLQADSASDGWHYRISGYVLSAP
jgi:hypothetical protein